MRILLVEENRRFCAALKGALQDAGYAVDAACDGPEGFLPGDTVADARACIRQSPPRL